MKKNLLKFLLLILMIVLMTALFGCKSSKAKKQFKIWFFERENAMADSWHFAIDKFKETHPGVEVLFELKSFEEIQETARMVLNSNEAPDIIQTNKGNATAGQYVKDGLIVSLESEAKKRGWDKILSPSVQSTCRYNEKGLMGQGDLWGVTTYGEFVMVYYNKDMFKKYNISVPTTFEEYEKACEAFIAKGIAPIAVGAGSKWPITHNWFELVLYKADRNLVNHYQVLTDDVDLTSPAFDYGTRKFAEQIKKGYYDKNAIGMVYEDANKAFVQQQNPMMLTGSWLYKWVADNVKDFEWDIFLMPGKKLNTGSGGNLFVVPKSAQNKEMAYDYIDIVLGKEAQTVMANAGGIPINADLSSITDQKTLRLNELFSSIVKNDGLAFYPDWPVPDFMAILTGNLQELFSGTKSVDDVLKNISEEYNNYREKIK